MRFVNLGYVNDMKTFYMINIHWISNIIFLWKVMMSVSVRGIFLKAVQFKLEFKTFTMRAFEKVMYII